MSIAGGGSWSPGGVQGPWTVKGQPGPTDARFLALVLKLLKMATGMRALLDTVVQALPQVGRGSVPSEGGHREPSIVSLAHIPSSLPHLVMWPRWCPMCTAQLSRKRQTQSPILALALGNSSGQCLPQLVHFGGKKAGARRGGTEITGN